MDTPRFGVLMLVNSLADAESKARVLQEIFVGYTVQVVPWQEGQVAGRTLSPSLDLQMRIQDLMLDSRARNQFAHAASAWRKHQRLPERYSSFDYTLGDLLEVPESFLKERKNAAKYLVSLKEFLAAHGLKLKGEGDA